MIRQNAIIAEMSFVVNSVEPRNFHYQIYSIRISRNFKKKCVVKFKAIIINNIVRLDMQTKKFIQFC